MLIIHHLGISQSDRIIWLCEELNVPYELKLYERDAVTRMAPPEYRALHEFGTAPVITDGHLTLGESGAIMEYIIARYANGRLSVKSDQENFADYLFWLHFANGSFMPSAMVDMIAGLVGPGPSAGVISALRERLDRAYAMLENRVASHEYLAGEEFTAADIINFFPLTTMRVFSPHDLARYPNTRAYIKRVAARPAYLRAMKIGDPNFSPPLE